MVPRVPLFLAPTPVCTFSFQTFKSADCDARKLRHPLSFLPADCSHTYCTCLHDHDFVCFNNTEPTLCPYIHITVACFYSEAPMGHVNVFAAEQNQVSATRFGQRISLKYCWVKKAETVSCELKR